MGLAACQISINGGPNAKHSVWHRSVHSERALSTEPKSFALYEFPLQSRRFEWLRQCLWARRRIHGDSSQSLTSHQAQQRKQYFVKLNGLITSFRLLQSAATPSIHGTLRQPLQRTNMPLPSKSTADCSPPTSFYAIVISLLIQI